MSERYEVVPWEGGYNVADNVFVNSVVFHYVMTKEQAEAEAERLNKEDK